MRFNNLRVVVISGLSGAGRSSALKCFEDLGFFCIDNLPPQLLPKFIELCTQSRTETNKIALGIDIRERDMLKWLRDKATLIMDTSDLNIHQLKSEVLRHFLEADKNKKIMVNIISFGFKYGVPYDVDLLFDVRFLPNPNFVTDLNPMSGQNREVAEYLNDSPKTGLFLERLFQFLDFLMSQYEQEGRYYLNIGVGCTGGRHRSVYIAETLERHIQAIGYDTTVRHRDIERMKV